MGLTFLELQKIMDYFIFKFDDIQDPCLKVLLNNMKELIYYIKFIFLFNIFYYIIFVLFIY
jgi:hypothetical protein